MFGVDPSIEELYRVFDLTGVLLNGIIGGTIARRQRYDIIGFLFLALFSSLGGGMVRDVLMQKGTAAAIVDPTYLGLAFVGAITAVVINFRGRTWELFKNSADSIVLGVWAVTGAVKALTFDMPLLSAVFMGVLTAVGGGMIRDVVTGQVPGIFGGGPLYAVPAVISASCMVGFFELGYPEWGMIISPLPGILLAMVSYWRGWTIPVHADWAPVNMTAVQARNLARRTQRKSMQMGLAAGRTVKRGARRVVRPPTRSAVVVSKLGRSVDDIANDAHKRIAKLWRKPPKKKG